MCIPLWTYPEHSRFEAYFCISFNQNNDQIKKVSEHQKDRQLLQLVRSCFLVSCHYIKKYSLIIMCMIHNRGRICKSLFFHWYNGDIFLSAQIIMTMKKECVITRLFGLENCVSLNISAMFTVSRSVLLWANYWDIFCPLKSTWWTLCLMALLVLLRWSVYLI